MAFRNAPEPQTEDEEGSVLDFPEEYVRAVPSRRPDIFPDLKEPKTPMPRPMPGTFVRSFVRRDVTRTERMEFDSVRSTRSRLFLVFVSLSDFSD